MLSTVGDLSAMAWIAAIGIALIAGVVHGYSGFGGALLMVPTLSLFIVPAEAVAVTLIGAIIGQFALARAAMPEVQWNECGPFLLGAIVLMPVGTWVLATSDAQTLRRIVGATTLIASAILMTGWAYRGTRGAIAAAAFGSLSGIVNGATGQGGPLAVAYFIAAPTGPVVQRANIIIAIAVQVVATLVLIAVSGVLTTKVLLLGLVMSAPNWLGTWLGNRLFSLIPQQNYKKLTILLMIAAGLIAIVR